MSEAIYLYCITNREEKDYGNIGIDNNRVYSVVYRDIAAIVHNCKNEPYESRDVEKAKGWVLSHNNVIEAVMGNKWVVIPFSFDTIINGGEKVLEKWLFSVYQQIKQELRRLNGKLEYGIDIYIKPAKIQVNSEKTCSGRDYLFRRKEENMAMKKLMEEVTQHKLNIIEKVEKLITDFQTTKRRNIPEGFEDKVLVVGFSCLADQKEFEGLSNLLDKLKEEGFIVRFTGPWPPYSFVNTLEGKNGAIKK